MKELVYNIGNVFDNENQDGCLSQYNCTRFYIPAYQRGYKWGSGNDGAVTILLNDLWDAYQLSKQHPNKEYYLQYITVKRNQILVDNQEEYCLEVIDGQQRLTTLSVILSVLAAILNDENIGAHKLHYAVRENFFSTHIYDQTQLLELVSTDWDVLSTDADFNRQDIFYLHSAVQKAHNFFSKVTTSNELASFYKYLTQSVMLIVNEVEKHIESETVFKNLNSNKVPLTEAELIKALILTEVGRGENPNSHRHFKEVMEVRANIGRQWDEMSKWANQPEVNTFFFNGKEGMFQLLRLTASQIKEADSIKYKDVDGKLSLFNFYHKCQSSEAVYHKLKSTWYALSDWFDNDEIYNLIGFCRFVKESGNNTTSFLRTCLACSDKENLKEHLYNHQLKLLPKSEIKTLRYGEHDNQIHAVLLSLSVFPKGLEKRFDFHEFIRNHWSLEHIFPQSPEGKDAVLNQTQKEAIIEMLGETITLEIRNVLSKETRSDEEKKIYYRALQELSPLNSIGNMCLLTSQANSSNGCMFFDDKRKNILRLIQKGSFVPKHTFDIFSKMINGLNSSDLSIWSKADIAEHTDYISQFPILELAEA